MPVIIGVILLAVVYFNRQKIINWLARPKCKWKTTGRFSGRMAEHRCAQCGFEIYTLNGPPKECKRNTKIRPL